SLVASAHPGWARWRSAPESDAVVDDRRRRYRPRPRAVAAGPPAPHAAPRPRRGRLVLPAARGICGRAPHERCRVGIVPQRRAAVRRPACMVAKSTETLLRALAMWVLVA